MRREGLWCSLAGPYGQLVIYLVAQAERGLYKTALAKLTYLVDLEHFARTGSLLTNAVYCRHQMGPLATELFLVNSLDGFELSIRRGPSGGVIYHPGPRPRFVPHLGYEGELSVMRVLSRFPDLDDIDQLLEVAYNTGPMLRILECEERDGVSYYGCELEFQPGDLVPP